MEFEEEDILENSPEISLICQNEPATALKAQMPNSLYREGPQLHEKTLFAKWLDECVEIIED